jgi:regulator of protease activity HflC (stomatin/prohibitin superfamily)
MSAIPTTSVLGDALKWSFRLLFGLVGLLALAWAVTGISRVAPDNQAVVTRFGQVIRESGPGLLVSWPAPIDHITFLPSPGRQVQFSPETLETGGSLPAPGDELSTGYIVNDEARENTWFFLTGDGGIVHLRVTVFYQITDPTAYVISADHVEPALRRAVVAAAVRVCASRDMDSILVARPERANDPTYATRRERFRTDLVALINQRLDAMGLARDGLGIRVARTDVVASIPAGAKASFDNVLQVSQQVERALAQARTTAEMRRQTAEQTREQTLDEARARAQETLHAAEGNSALVLALGKDTTMSHSTVLDQVYRERIKSLFDVAERIDTVPTGDHSRVIVPGVAQ